MSRTHGDRASGQHGTQATLLSSLFISGQEHSLSYRISATSTPTIRENGAPRQPGAAWLQFSMSHIAPGFDGYKRSSYESLLQRDMEQIQQGSDNTGSDRWTKPWPRVVGGSPKHSRVPVTLTVSSFTVGRRISIASQRSIFGVLQTES